MTASVRLSAQAAAALRRRAVRGYPLEECGLLLGNCDGGAIAVRRALRLPNRARRRDRAYRVAAADYLRCDLRARRAGLEVVGVWHSHPDGADAPSPIDHRLAWPRWCYLIAAVDGGGLRGLRAWELSGGRLREIALEPCPR